MLSAGVLTALLCGAPALVIAYFSFWVVVLAEVVAAVLCAEDEDGRVRYEMDRDTFAACLCGSIAGSCIYVILSWLVL